MRHSDRPRQAGATMLQAGGGGQQGCEGRQSKGQQRLGTVGSSPGMAGMPANQFIRPSPMWLLHCASLHRTCRRSWHCSPSPVLHTQGTAQQRW
jgi:hypothetical protein